MLWNASAIEGYAVEGTDGALGTVSDLMFDERHWGVRWLVVDTGTWLSKRNVLLPLSVLGEPDPVDRRVTANLTMRQVEKSPVIDIAQPFSGEIEAAIYKGYATKPDRERTLVTANAAQGDPSASWLSESNGSVTGQAEADWHLHGIAAIKGFGVEGVDGDIGHVEDFLFDSSDWTIRYIVVHIGVWWPGEKVLISPLSIERIDWARSILNLDATQRKVKASPAYREGGTVDGAYDESFMTYYGIR